MTETAVMIVDRRLYIRQANKPDPLNSVQGAVACKLAETEAAEAYTSQDGDRDSMMETETVIETYVLGAPS